MEESIKFIIQELNKPPFNKNYTVVTFDSIRDRQLLKLLNEVLQEIAPKHKVDIDVEEPEMTISRMLHLLRIFNYSPIGNDVEQFSRGLLAGDKAVVYPLMEWLLQRRPELKKRAYLAAFLIRIDVPQEFLGDVEINDAYQQYLALLEQFKECHKVCEQLRNSSVSTSEIKRDIQNMTEEKHQLTKRIERMKKRVENYPNVEALLEIARNIRQEKDREESLNLQKQEMAIAIHHIEQRIERMSQTVKEMKQSRNDVTPQALVQRLEEELKVNTYLVKEKFPKELKSRRQLVDDLQNIHEQPNISKASLDPLYAKIQEMNTKINKLVEKRMLGNEPMDDKLSMFRQQAAIIARKKESTAEAVNELRNEFSGIEEKVREKAEQLKDLGGVEILKGDEFKQYVTKLRAKSNIYKKKRQQQAEVRAEIGVLSRTEEILKSRYEQSEQTLSAVEAEKGIAGIRKVKEDLEKVSTVKGGVDEEKAETLSDISGMVMELNKKIQAKKSALAPLIKELQPLRQEYQDLLYVYDEKKSAYNSVAAGLEANSSKLDREVKTLEEESTSKESGYHLMNCQLQIINVQLEQAESEMKNYLSADPAVKKNSLREQYTQCIQEQEKLGKALKEEQKSIRDDHQGNVLQMEMWKDLQKLMECKRRCASRRVEPKYTQEIGPNSQSLALI